MNNIKELIESIRSQRSYQININIPFDESHLVLNALEKQVPKKPRWKTDMENYSSYFICPTCGALVTINNNYCSGNRMYGEESEQGCGQALDWSES